MIIRRSVLEAVHADLERAYPNEGCGLLVGRGEAVPRVLDRVPVDNRRLAEGAAARRYLIDPDAFRRVSREVERRGLEIVGVYHSHPDAAATPSAYDREHAWPWYCYLIVGIRQGVARDARAWRLRDDRSGFDEHPLEIEHDGGV